MKMDANTNTCNNATRAMTFEELCNAMREKIGDNARITKDFMVNRIFDNDNEQAYIGQHDEMKANITLAYRHLEDARMRIGKILQAAGDGVSILDK